mmetsp:Transcript_2383/g.16014  ORF Transcript_2383/g.16014 Transcript_2383/m.16014 type:complete len:231 (-) Transcript_2383:1482-2174(-)
MLFLCPLSTANGEERFLASKTYALWSVVPAANMFESVGQNWTLQMFVLQSTLPTLLCWHNDHNRIDPSSDPDSRRVGSEGDKSTLQTLDVCSLYSLTGESEQASHKHTEPAQSALAMCALMYELHASEFSFEPQAMSATGRWPSIPSATTDLYSKILIFLQTPVAAKNSSSLSKHIEQIISMLFRRSTCFSVALHSILLCVTNFDMSNAISSSISVVAGLSTSPSSLAFL